MKHLCVLVLYKNTEHIIRCYESLNTPSVEFWLIENHSENSLEIQKYFHSVQNVGRYFYFPTNITCNATSIIVKEFIQDMYGYDFVTVSDGDLVVDSAEDTFTELRTIAQLPEVGVACTELKLDNLPTWIPDATRWIPLPVEHTLYLEGYGGTHLMTLAREKLYVLDHVYPFLDGEIANALIRHGLKWTKTKINKSLHLTWDYYKPDHPYYLEKARSSHDIWRHGNTCEYQRLI